MNVNAKDSKALFEKNEFKKTNFKKSSIHNLFLSLGAVNALAILLGSLVFASLFGSISKAQTKTILITDFDGTLTNERFLDGGTFLTNVVLFRVEGRNNILAPVANGPQTVEITNQEFEKVKPYLALAAQQQVTIARTVTLANGQKIKPGEYYFWFPYSFKYYGEAPPSSGDNYLLNAQKLAEERTAAATSNGATWKGKMWPVLQAFSQRSLEDKNVHILIQTARGHSESEWLDWGRHMVEIGELPVALNPKFIHNMSRSEYDSFSRTQGRPPPDDIVHRKLGFNRQFLINLLRVEPKPGERHQVIFAENNQNILRMMYALFEEFIFAERLRADFTVINAGTATELRDLGKFPIETIGADAIWKKASPEHLERLSLAGFFSGSPSAPSAGNGGVSLITPLVPNSCTKLFKLKGAL